MKVFSVFHMVLTLVIKLCFCVISEAKQEQEKTEPPGQNISSLVQSGVSAQPSQSVTLQVRLLNKLI